MKDLDLKRLGPLLGSQDFPFHLLELRGDEALTSSGCLLTGVIVGDVPKICRGDLDEVSENSIEADFQRLDPSSPDFLFLKRSDPLLPIGGSPPKFIQRVVESRADHPTIADCRWRFRDEG